MKKSIMNRFCSLTMIAHGTCLATILTALMLWACGNGAGLPGTAPPNTSPAAGAISFSVQWLDNAHGRVSNTSPSGDVCVDYGIDTIVIEVHDATGAVVNSQNRDCTDHQATISRVSTGSGLWLSLNGMVAGTAHWSGQSAVFDVTENQTTDAGSVSMHYIGDDSVRPQVQAASPADEAVNVSLDAKVTAIFDEDVVAASVVPAISVSDGTTPLAGTVAYDANTRTATFTPDANLPESTVLTALVGASVEDLAGNQMAGDVAWQFTSTSIDAPSATTLAATAVTQAGATLNGEVNPNGLATTCWFEYGADTSYGQSTAVVDVGAGRDTQAVSADIGGLASGTGHHFRLVAESSGGTSEGADSAFQTDAVWARSYGEADTDAGNIKIIQPTSDGGYIAATQTNSFGAGALDIWILKLDGFGNIEWQKTFGGESQDLPIWVQQTAEGGYVVAGHTLNDSAGIYDIWVLKLKADGSNAWAKTYGGTDDDRARSMQQTADGGYIIAGDTQSFGAALKDVWIIKLNPSGDVVWQNRYGGDDYDLVYDIRQTSDGGYIVAAETKSFELSSQAMWVLKLDADGSVAWQKAYSGSERDYCRAALQTLDGGYLVAGFSSSFGSGGFADIWILKLDAAGRVQWQSTYGRPNGDTIVSMALTDDGGYIVTGNSANPEDQLDSDVWTFKLNADGTIAWEKTYGGSQKDQTGEIHQTTDGGYIIAGSTTSFVAGGSIYPDFWVLKIGRDGSLGCGLDMDSSALRYTPSVSGVDTVTDISATTAIVSYTIHHGTDTATSYQVQCPQP